MSEHSKKYNLGVTLSSLGGLLTIFSMTLFEDNDWQLVTAVAGAGLALVGVVLIAKEKKE